MGTIGAETERLRIAVTTRPNGRRGAVFLTFVDPCPHCGRPHVHGNEKAEPDADGTYGTRLPDCGAHTHELTATGRRRRVYAPRVKLCPIVHPSYVLVPAEVAP